MEAKIWNVVELLSDNEHHDVHEISDKLGLRDEEVERLLILLAKFHLVDFNATIGRVKLASRFAALLESERSETS